MPELNPMSCPGTESRRSSGVRRQPALLVGLLVAAATLLAESLWAQQSTSTTQSTASPPPKRTDIYLAEPSGVLVGVEGYGGITTLSMNNETLGRAYAGAMIRTRFSRLEFSGFAETSDYTVNKWRLFGGTVGTFWHLHNWVDVDGAVGVAQRTYISLDSRYGAGGAYASVPSLILRLGISDRVSDGTVSPRLGAALYSAIDLSHESSPWKYEADGNLLNQGTTRFGGFTIGLMMTFGVDFALGGKP